MESIIDQIIDKITRIIEVYIQKIGYGEETTQLLVVGVLCIALFIGGFFIRIIIKRKKMNRAFHFNRNELESAGAKYGFLNVADEREGEKHISNILDLPKCSIIYAPSGYGKSFLLWKYAKQLNENSTFLSKKKIFPVFFHVKEFQADGRGLDEYILNEYLKGLCRWDNSGSLEDLLKKYKNQFVIMIDGLESIRSEEEINRLIEFIFKYIKFNIKIVFAIKVEIINDEKDCEKKIKQKYKLDQIERGNIKFIKLERFEESVVNKYISTHNSLNVSKYLYDIIRIPIFFEMFKNLTADLPLKLEKREENIIDQILEQYFKGKQSDNSLIYTTVNYILPLTAVYQMENNVSLEDSMYNAIDCFNGSISSNNDVEKIYNRNGMKIPVQINFCECIDEMAINSLGVIYQENRGSEKYFWHPNDYYENWFIAKGMFLLYITQRFGDLKKCLKKLNGDLKREFLQGDFNNIKTYELILAKFTSIDTFKEGGEEYLSFLLQFFKNMVYYYDKFGNRKKNSGFCEKILKLFLKYGKSMDFTHYLEGVETITYAMLHIDLDEENRKIAADTLNNLLEEQNKPQYRLYKSYTLGDLGAYCLYRKETEKKCQECIAKKVLVKLNLIDKNQDFFCCPECAKKFHEEGLKIRESIQKDIQEGVLSAENLAGLTPVTELDYRFSRSYTCLGTDEYYLGNFEEAVRLHETAIDWLKKIKNTNYKYVKEILECYERYLGTLKKYYKLPTIDKQCIEEKKSKMMNRLFEWLIICENNQEKIKFIFDDHVNLIYSRYMEIYHEVNVDNQVHQKFMQEVKKMKMKINQKYGGLSV